MAAKSECLPDDHVYVVADKQVKDVEDIQKWEQSEAYEVSNVFKYNFVKVHLTGSSQHLVQPLLVISILGLKFRC